MRIHITHLVVFFWSTEAHREGDGQVDLSSNVGHIPLPEEARQTHLGAIWREEKMFHKSSEFILNN